MELPLGYYLRSVCLHINSNSTCHAAICVRWHPRSTPSEQYGTQGSTQMGGKPIERSPSKGTWSQKRRRTEAMIGSRDNRQPPPRSTPPSSGRDARVPPIAWSLNEVALAFGLCGAASRLSLHLCQGSSPAAEEAARPGPTCDAALPSGTQ